MMRSESSQFWICGMQNASLSAATVLFIKKIVSLCWKIAIMRVTGISPQFGGSNGYCDRNQGLFYGKGLHGRQQNASRLQLCQQEQRAESGGIHHRLQAERPA